MELARTQVLYIDVYFWMTYWLDVFLALNCAIFGRRPFERWAMCVWTVNAKEVILQIDQITADMRHCRTTNDTALRPTFVAVLISYRIHHI
jgi:hypothetical protein